MNKKNRRAHLEELKREKRTMLFYEAPHKLLATLPTCGIPLGPDRRIALCRELTKLHEEIRRTTLEMRWPGMRRLLPRGSLCSWWREAPPRPENVPHVRDRPAPCGIPSE